MSKRVVVSAGGAGIGLAIAKCFQAVGDQVFICDISAEAIADVNRANNSIHGVVADVSKPDEVEHFFRSAVEAMGGVDVLVNNAGIAGPQSPVEHIDYHDWDITIRVNLSGMFYCIKQVVPIMKAQHSGCIINISTGSTRTSLPERLPYVASKEGVNGITGALARELGPFNIRCNSILPGAVKGPRGDRVITAVAKRKGIPVEEAREKSLRYISMRTEVAPSEIGDMACFLASDAARHVTGQFIGVCGNVEWEE